MADRPRVAHAVRIVDPTDRPLTVIHLHGLRDPVGQGHTPARRAQAERIAQFVSTATGSLGREQR